MIAHMLPPRTLNVLLPLISVQSYNMALLLISPILQYGSS
jgi:hypothetical protein